MKNLILGTALLLTQAGFAQATSGPEYECARYRTFGAEAVKAKKYAEAAMNYNIAEKICGNFDKVAYTRLIDCYRNAVNTEVDPVKKKLLIDTLLTAYDRAEAKIGADEGWYLQRGLFQISATMPENKKGDLNLATGIQKAGLTVADYFVTSYYSNINKMYSVAVAPEKDILKKRLLSEYFVLSKLALDAKFKPEAQVSLDRTFNSVLKVYADFQPDLKLNMASFPKDKEAKKTAVKNLMTILEAKKWQENKEYEMLSDTLLAIEPSADAYFAKGKSMMAKKRNDDAATAFRKAREYNPSAEQKVDMEYYSFVMASNAGRKKDAFEMAKGLDGKYRTEGLRYRAQYVASTVNSCGTSTFDRKCNFYYAYQLASEAGDAKLMATYKKSFPTKKEMFNVSKSIGDSVSLSCWGVTITLK